MQTILNKEKFGLIRRVQALILCLCIGITGTISLSGCSKNASTNADGTIYLETSKQSNTTDGTVSQPANSESQSDTSDNTTSSAIESTVETTEAAATIAPVSINLIAVGDMLLHGGIHNSALQPDGSYNYAHVFEHTKDRIASADIAVANQEVILGGVELGVSSYPTFNRSLIHI